MNNCLLEVQVKTVPTVRYTQDKQTPIAEMEVSFEGLRPDDTPSQLKVVGWGNMAQELQSRVKEGQKLLLEGRLRMNTVPRQDGTKEKRAELTLSKFHFLSQSSNGEEAKSPSAGNAYKNNQLDEGASQKEVNWNSSPLVPNTDDIPF